MKNFKSNRGISLILFVVLVLLVIVAGAGSVAYILLTRNEPVENTANEDVIAVRKENKIEKTNTQKPEVTTSEVEPLEFTPEFLQTGESYGDVKIVENRVDESIALSITGAATNDIDGSSLVNGKNRWYKTIDLTDYTTLEFYARKGHDHGDLMVGIDKNIIKRVRFPEFNSVWTKFTIDVSDYIGEHVVVFAGGYADFSGSEESNTQYRNIRLK